MKAILLIIFMILSAAPLVEMLMDFPGLTASGGGPLPAFVAYSGCRLKSRTGMQGCGCKTSPNIQMGEAYSNIRIQNQLSGFFLGYTPGQPNYDSEGGPYGIGVGCNCYPKQWDLEWSNNLADFCFFWHSPTESAIPKTIPGEIAVPMPIISALTISMAAMTWNWYEQGQPLAQYASWKPLYRGIWFPPKDSATQKPLFCNGLNLNCPTPTFWQLKTNHLASVGCDVSKCRPHFA